MGVADLFFLILNLFGALLCFVALIFSIFWGDPRALIVFGGLMAANLAGAFSLTRGD